MFGMVLAIGILVDDAIVVVENVERIMAEEGLPPKEATRKAMTQITGAIIGITLVLMAVFVPMASSGFGRHHLPQFSVTMVSAIAFSALLALSLTPALCATLLKPVEAGHGHRARARRRPDGRGRARRRGPARAQPARHRHRRAHQRHARAAAEPGGHLDHRSGLPRPQPGRWLRPLLLPARPAGRSRTTPSTAPASWCARATRSTSGCARPGPTPCRTRNSSTFRNASEFHQRTGGRRRCCRRSATPSPTISVTSSSTRAAATWCASAATSPARRRREVYPRRPTAPTSFRSKSTSAIRTTCSPCRGASASSRAFDKQERIVDRFFLGGENLRGFRWRALVHATSTPATPSVPDALDAVHRVALPAAAAGGTRPDWPRLRGCRLLSQSGAPEPGRQVVDDPTPRVGAGVGVSWRSAVGLINIDVAQAVVKESYDETQRLPLRLRHAFLISDPSECQHSAFPHPLRPARCPGSLLAAPFAYVPGSALPNQDWFVPGQGEAARAASVPPRQGSSSSSVRRNSSSGRPSPAAARR